jgi:hypothetical protein
MMPRAILLLCLLSFGLNAAATTDSTRTLQPEPAPVAVLEPESAPISTIDRIDLTAPLPQEEATVRESSPVKLNLPVDAAITIPATAWTVWAFGKVYDKPRIDSSTLAALTKDKIPKFDHWAVRHSDEAAKISDYAFYGAMPYPLVLLGDRAIRKDWARVYGLYWEAMAITGLLYTGTNYTVDRYRPETYDESKPFGDRQSGNEKNSFFAGHPALVATATFFTASIYDEYHHDKKLKWLFYGIATAATGTTIYLRHQAGKHFPSDLLVGTLVGVGSGMLVPRLHRNKAFKGRAWNVSPSIGQGYGLAATYRF